MPDNISLVIPVKDEEASIDGLLKSVMSQTLPPREIVIADGGSRDRTTAIIESYIGKGSPIKLIKADRAFPGKGRNIAIEAAASDLIAMTDAGIVLDKDWLNELLRPFKEDPEVEVVYGSYEPVTDSLFKECFALLALSAPVLINGRRTRSYFVASSMIKRKVWSAVGGFPDFRAAEDKIFIDRIRDGRFKTAFAAGAKVYWNIPGGFREAFRKTSLYSMHDLIAGRFRDWHRSVLFMYLCGAVMLALCLAMSPVWLFILPACALARGAWILLKKSPGKKAAYFLNMKRFALLVILMLWIDLAMFWGVVKYLRRPR